MGLLYGENCMINRFGDICRLNVENRQFYLPPPSFNAPALGNSSEFRDETCCRKTSGMGLLYGENVVIVASTVFDWSTRVTDRQTYGRMDRQMDAR